MTMVFTDAALGEFLAGDLDWVADDFILILVDNVDTPDSNPFLSDLDPAHTVGNATVPSRTIAGRTALAGTCIATGIPSGKTITGMWVVQDTGTPASSRLVAYTDTNDDSTPLSYLTDGSDLSIEFLPYVLSI